MFVSNEVVSPQVLFGKLCTCVHLPCRVLSTLLFSHKQLADKKLHSGNLPEVSADFS
ncbi:MAG: hypothetical protein ACI8WW_002091, partial [Oceanospirillaceae bacterium]